MMLRRLSLVVLIFFLGGELLLAQDQSSRRRRRRRSDQPRTDFSVEGGRVNLDPMMTRFIFMDYQNSFFEDAVRYENRLYRGAYSILDGNLGFRAGPGEIDVGLTYGGWGSNFYRSGPAFDGGFGGTGQSEFSQAFGEARIGYAWNIGPGRLKLGTGYAGSGSTLNISHNVIFDHGNRFALEGSNLKASSDGALIYAGIRWKLTSVLSVELMGSGYPEHIGRMTNQSNKVSRDSQVVESGTTKTTTTTEFLASKIFKSKTIENSGRGALTLYVDAGSDLKLGLTIGHYGTHTKFRRPQSFSFAQSTQTTRVTAGGATTETVENIPVNEDAFRELVTDRLQWRPIQSYENYFGAKILVSTPPRYASD